MSRVAFAKITCVLLWAPGRALAHAAEGGFVLLLPTDIYIAAGVATVALTVIALAFLPGRIVSALFRPLLRLRVPALPVRHVTRIGALGALLVLLWQGVAGPRDPVSNPLVLTIWVFWWIGLVTVQGLVGDVWRWINPWLGVTTLTGYRRIWKYPKAWSYWPAVLGLLLFSGFLLADIAPTDPGRLASAVAIYFLVSLAGLYAFGPVWLLRAEAVSVLMRAFAGIAPVVRCGRQVEFGLWGWRRVAAPAPALSLAVVMVLLLGLGSFDGLNETFWWIGVIGLNPLEFTGRSAAQWQNLTGLLLASAALLLVFWSGLWAGAQFSDDPRPSTLLFRLYAPTLLPIALGYHIAHYLTAALVEAQYLWKWLDDPMGTGLHWLGQQEFQVTTGFFNRQDSVELIFLMQAGAVVLGHVVAILMAHAIALRATGSHRVAVLGQLPLALFMIAYTFLGLWLLATPRGL
ncbi:MAG: hypothetical protein AAF678_03210 [Pseudomonadota bacterium]